MSAAWQCDECGKFYPTVGYAGKGPLPIRIELRVSPLASVAQLEVCPTCWAELSAAYKAWKLAKATKPA